VFQGLTGRKDILLFHWKPTRTSVRLPDQPAGIPSDPRTHQYRSFPLALFYLCYHWLGFWIGYFRHVYPARIKNRAVIGDRYAYEFFLDPRRLRLRAPEWLLKFAAYSTPKPGMVVALTASPPVITARKPELSLLELESYQRKLREMAAGDTRVALVSTDGTIKCVAAEISTQVVCRLATSN
jgi:thymidylate kinase